MNNLISRRAVLGLGISAAASSLLCSRAWASAPKRRVVVWSEGTAPKEVYPNDINGAIAEGLKKSLPDWDVVLAGIDDPDQGAGDAMLKETAVLMWWGHKRHREVKDEVVERIYERVSKDGMGFIALHSSHFAKPYKRLMGTPCSWSEYKADGTSVIITVKESGHPIVQGVKDFSLPLIERYGEPFAVPEPDAVPLDGVYTKPDGTTAPGRMGLCWTIGQGRVFYFTPGHETYDDFFLPEVRLIMANAVKWAAMVS
jgi:trehalose utilization protein